MKLFLESVLENRAKIGRVQLVALCECLKLTSPERETDEGLVRLIAGTLDLLPYLNF